MAGLAEQPPDCMIRKKLVQTCDSIEARICGERPEASLLTGRGLSLNSASRRNTTQFVDSQPELSSPGKDDR